MSIGLGLNLALRGGLPGPLDPVFGNGTDPLIEVAYQGDGPAVPGAAQRSGTVRLGIPVRALNGDLLLFFQCNGSGLDYTAYAIAMHRSTDNGRTWTTTPTTVYSHAAYVSGSAWIGLGSVVVEKVAGTGRIHVHYLVATGAAGTATLHKQYTITSDDHGVNWGASTEITSQVKVTGAGAPAGHNFPSTAWTHCCAAFGPGIQLTTGPSAGRLIVPCDHRTGDFTSSTTVYSHFIYSDNNGTTWNLCDGAFQAAANQGSNECCVTETSTPGRLIAHHRSVQTPTRYQSVSTDSGITWSNMATTTNLFGGGSSGVAGDVKQLGDLLVACYSADPTGSSRNSLAVAISRDQGATWAAADVTRIFGRPCSYATMLVDGDSVLIFYERGFGNSTGSNANTENQGIAMVRVSRRWLLAQTPRYSDWHFGEEASGTRACGYGHTIPDYGNLLEKATALPVATRPLYSADGLVLTGSAEYLQVSTAADPIFELFSGSGNSMTFEIEATVAQSTNGALFSRYNGTNGVLFEVASGVLKATMKDGTNTATITGGTSLNGAAVRRCYALVIDRTTNLMSIYVNGVSDATPVSISSIGNANLASAALLIGRINDASLKLTGTIHTAKVTRGVVTTFASVGRVKRTIQSLRRYSSPSLANVPATISELKCLALQTYDNGLDLCGDKYTNEAVPMPIQSGRIVRSFRDGAPAGRNYFAASEGVAPYYTTDSKMGPCIAFNQGSTPNTFFLAPDVLGATTGFDFIQNTGKFAIFGCFNIAASTGQYQVLATNCDAASAQPGFAIYRLDGASSKLALQISKGGSTNRISETISTAPVIAYGETWFFCFRCRGASQTVDLFLAKITSDYAPGGTAPAVTKYTSSGNVGSDGTFNSTIGLHLGNISSGARGFNGTMKNFGVFDLSNIDLSDADVQTLANFCTAG